VSDLRPGDRLAAKCRVFFFFFFGKRFFLAAHVGTGDTLGNESN